jgi:hypothetical protein
MHITMMCNSTGFHVSVDTTRTTEDGQTLCRHVIEKLDADKSEYGCRSRDALVMSLNGRVMHLDEPVSDTEAGLYYLTVIPFEEVNRRAFSDFLEALSAPTLRNRYADVITASFVVNTFPFLFDFFHNAEVETTPRVYDFAIPEMVSALMSMHPMYASMSVSPSTLSSSSSQLYTDTVHQQEQLFDRILQFYRMHNGPYHN